MIKNIVVDMLGCRGLKGLPSDFEFNKEGTKLFFLSPTTSSELFYVDLKGDNKGNN